VIVSILEKIRDTIALDAAIESFCQSNFSKSITVFLGKDTKDLPSPDSGDYPIALIHGVSRAFKGEKDSQIIYEVSIGAGITSETITIGAKTKTYNGFLFAENLRELIEASLLTANFPGAVGVTGDSIQEQLFPVFVSFTNLEIIMRKNYQKPIGR